MRSLEPPPGLAFAAWTAGCRGMARFPCQIMTICSFREFSMRLSGQVSSARVAASGGKKQGIFFFPRLSGVGFRGEDNPVSHWMWRRQRSISQMGMLVAATLFICGVAYYGKTRLGVRKEVFAYVLMRWALAEFFWIWMAADHLVSSVVSLRRKRTLDEWKVTLLSPFDMARGFVGPALGFLLVSHTFHCVIDALIPYGRGNGWLSNRLLIYSDWGDIWIWRVGLSTGFWAAGLGTLAMAAPYCYRVALDCPLPAVNRSWFSALRRMILLTAVWNVVGFLVGMLGMTLLKNLTETFLIGIIPVPEESVWIGVAFVIATWTSAWMKIQFSAREFWKAAVADYSLGADDNHSAREATP